MKNWKKLHSIAMDVLFAILSIFLGENSMASYHPIAIPVIWGCEIDGEISTIFPMEIHGIAREKAMVKFRHTSRWLIYIVKQIQKWRP